MAETKVNLTQIDRWGYVAGGLALMGWGLRRRGLTRGGAAGLGGWLLYQAYTGYNPMFRPLGIRVNREPAERIAHETIVLDQAITIKSSREELYRFWRDVSNVPSFAPRVLRVEAIDDTHSRWYLQAVGTKEAVWASAITRDQPGVEIAWRATRANTPSHFGSVEFRDASGGRGNVVAVHLEYV